MYLDAKIDDISWSQPYPKSGKPKKYLDVLLSKIPALSYKYFAQTWIAMFPPPRQKISSSHLTRVIWVSNILLPSFDTPYPNLWHPHTPSLASHKLSSSFRSWSTTLVTKTASSPCRTTASFWSWSSPSRRTPSGGILTGTSLFTSTPRSWPGTTASWGLVVVLGAERGEDVSALITMMKQEQRHV